MAQGKAHNSIYSNSAIHDPFWVNRWRIYFFVLTNLMVKLYVLFNWFSVKIHIAI